MSMEEWLGAESNRRHADFQVSTAVTMSGQRRYKSNEPRCIRSTMAAVESHKVSKTHKYRAEGIEG
jgi:hypothetical protein